MTDITDTEWLRAKRYFVGLLLLSKGGTFSAKQITMDLMPPPDGSGSAITVKLPDKITFSKIERAQIKEDLAALNIRVVDAHEGKEKAPLLFTLSTGLTHKHIVQMMAGKYLKGQGDKHQEQEERRTQQHVAKLIFAISNQAVPAEEVTVAIKPYADDAGSYLEISVPEKWQFSKDHRSCIETSITLGRKMTTTAHYPGYNADRPLVLTVNPPYKEGQKLDGADAMHALASGPIQAYEWKGSGYGPKVQKTGRYRR